MKRKNVFWLTAGVLVLLALYGVWHYSPLRYITRSKSQPDTALSSTADSRNKPIVVTKKVLPETIATQQTGDLPQTLVVLKKLPQKGKSRPVKQQMKSTAPAAAVKKTSQPAPDGSLSAKAGKTRPLQSDKPSKPQPVQKAAASVKQEPFHPYSIMLSSCRLPQSARKIVSDYKKAGFSPYVVKVKFDSGEEWLRVMTGHYKTRRDALKVKNEQQLSAAIVKKTPYTNLIGTFTALESMQADINRLRKSGYSPYFLKTPNGRYKLVVGAFVTKEGAENQSKELQAKGIQSQVIKR
jgi:cell division septation protein DedD